MPLQAELNPKFCQTLISGVEWSRRQLHFFNKKRLEVLRQYAGAHFSRSGAKARVPQNFIRMMATIYARYLASGNPMCLIEEKHPALRAMARSAQDWAKQAFSDMGLVSTLQSWAMDGILSSYGIIKVCGDIHSLYVDLVDPERAVWDMLASSWDQIDYIGDLGTDAKEDMVGEGWDEDRVRRIRGEMYTNMNELGGEKTQSLSQEDSYQYKRIREYIDNVRLFLPRENIIVTFHMTNGTIDPRPLRVQEYRGERRRAHPTGPYHLFGIDKVPGNIMCSPVVHNILDMHDAINQITRKLLRQSRDQKTVGLVQATYADEGKIIADAPDGSMKSVTSPDSFKEIRMRGPDQAMAGFMQVLKLLISWHGGNFDVLAGLGAQADTATQEQLLSSASSKSMQHMQQQMLQATGSLMRDIIWHYWYSQKVLTYTMKAPGTDIAVPWSITPQERMQAPMDQMTFSIHPYSMRPVTPELRMAQLEKLFMQYILPGAPFLSQMGEVPNISAFVRKQAELMDLPYLDEMIISQQQQPLQGPQQQEGPRVPPRPGVGQYTRTNRSSDENMAMDAIRQMDTGDAA